jgi:hypothetical protein
LRWRRRGRHASANPDAYSNSISNSHAYADGQWHPSRKLHVDCNGASWDGNSSNPALDVGGEVVEHGLMNILWRI